MNAVRLSAGSRIGKFSISIQPEPITEMRICVGNFDTPVPELVSGHWMTGLTILQNNLNLLSKRSPDPEQAGVTVEMCPDPIKTHEKLLQTVFIIFMPC